jgi:phage terminase small subunit
VQNLLKRLEDAAMAQRLGMQPSTAAAEWQQQIHQLSEAAAVINEQEQLLDMRCTHFGDIEEAQRTLQEMQQHADQAAADAAAQPSVALAVSVTAEGSTGVMGHDASGLRLRHRAAEFGLEQCAEVVFSAVGLRCERV